MGWKFWQAAPKKERVEPVMDEVRPSSRALAMQRRNFVAANTQIIQGWANLPTSCDTIIHRDHAKLVARSREQAINNPYFKRFFSIMRSNVVGPNGFTFQSLAVNDRGQPDFADRAAVEKAMKQWARPEFSDFKQRINLKDKQRLIMDAMARDGEAFIRHHVDKENPYGYSTSLIDSVLLPVDHCNAELRNGNYIRFSIEFDKRDRPVAYYVTTTSKVNFDYQHGSRNFLRIPANEITHIFLPEWIDQKRGIPWGATALMRAKMLDGYEEAAVVNARAGASKMGFLRSPNGGADEYVGEGVDALGNHVTTLEAGTIEDIGTQEFVPFDPKYPDQQFELFVKQILRGISAGLGLSYYVLANDLEGVNYTSSRTGALEDREIYKALQDFLIENVMIVITERWLKFALLTGAITNDAGIPLPLSKLTKYQAFKFQGRRWAWVDPMKDNQANVLAIDNKLTSRAQVIRETGRDPDEVWAEIEAEEKRLGISGNKAPSAPAPIQQEETTQEDMTDD